MGYLSIKMTAVVNPDDSMFPMEIILKKFCLFAGLKIISIVNIRDVMLTMLDFWVISVINK